ncbi:MAG: hypothetical protein NPIRA03_10160 [Nitrospirales bacterium]|nr:MAG: hypothetical protein NPIRA03_10160 [Nitrospirales bacterium]
MNYQWHSNEMNFRRKLGDADHDISHGDSLTDTRSELDGIVSNAVGRVVVGATIF